MADSWRFIKLAREAPITGAAKAVLYALASRADDDGKCWPSLKTLKIDAGMTSKTGLRNALRQLQALGYITVIVRPAAPGRRQSSNLYRLREMGSPGDP